jgi:hypothetical protein
MTVQFGVDIFLNQAPTYQHQRLALVTNQAATTAAYIPSRQALLSAGYQLVKLFSPEHGLEAIGDDGRLMPNGIDALTGLPIISLYGEKLQPSPEDLADIDAVIVDLPDVGSLHLLVDAHAHHGSLYASPETLNSSGSTQSSFGAHGAGRRAVIERGCVFFVHWPMAHAPTAFLYLW